MDRNSEPSSASDSEIVQFGSPKLEFSLKHILSYFLMLNSFLIIENYVWVISSLNNESS